MARSARFSQQKGARAMNEIALYFSEVYEHELEFAKQRKVRSGDLFTAKEVPFIIEVKNQECWKYGHFLNCSGRVTCKLQDYWFQVHRDCALDGNRKHPLLIFTKNREPYFFMMSHTLFADKRFIFSLQQFIKDGITFVVLPENKAVVIPALPIALMRKYLQLSAKK